MTKVFSRLGDVGNTGDEPWGRALVCLGQDATTLVPSTFKAIDQEMGTQ